MVKSQQHSSDSKPRGPHVDLVTLKSRPELGLTYHPGADVINGNNRYATIIANNLSPESSLNYYFNIQGGPIDKRISVSCIREFSLIRADFLRFLAVFCEILAHGFGNR